MYTSISFSVKRISVQFFHIQIIAYAGQGNTMDIYNHYVENNPNFFISLSL